MKNIFPSFGVLPWYAHEYVDRFDEVTKLCEEAIMLGEIGLDEINAQYKNMIINLKLIDFDEAKKLYDRLDIISENIKKKFDTIQAQVKKLKVELMKSILEDKIEDVRKTSDEIQNLITKYA